MARINLSKSAVLTALIAGVFLGAFLSTYFREEPPVLERIKVEKCTREPWDRMSDLFYRNRPKKQPKHFEISL